MYNVLKFRMRPAAAAAAAMTTTWEEKNLGWSKSLGLPCGKKELVRLRVFALCVRLVSACGSRRATRKKKLFLVRSPAAHRSASRDWLGQRAQQARAHSEGEREGERRRKRGAGQKSVRSLCFVCHCRGAQKQISAPGSRRRNL